MVNSFLVTVTITSVREPKCCIVSNMNNWPRPPRSAYASSGARDVGCEAMKEITDCRAGDANVDVVGRIRSGEVNGRRCCIYVTGCSGNGRIIVGRRSRMVNEDIVNIICCPVNFGYFEKIWSCVEFVNPSINRLPSVLHCYL